MSSVVHYPGQGRPGSTACGYGLTGPEPDFRITDGRAKVTCGRCKASMAYRNGAESASSMDADRLRAAVEAHEPTSGATQWYVDEHVIDCDAGEFWAVIAAALEKG